MWNKDTHGDFSFVIPTEDGGFKFFPFAIENATVYMEVIRGKIQDDDDYCGAV